jgi:hypothetical protein
MTAQPSPSDRLEVRYPGLPFSTCRECAVHLRQLGVAAEVQLRTTPIFDARLDQVESIHFSLPEVEADRSRLGEILEYYAELYRKTPVAAGDVPCLVVRGREMAWSGHGSWRQVLLAC